MRLILLATSAVLTLLGGCARVVPPPAPQPAPARPIPRPAPAIPAPLSSDWRDWPITPGTWHYARASGGSTATFGRDARAWSLRLTCLTAERRISIEKSGPGTPTLTVHTTTLTRTVPASSVMRHTDDDQPLPTIEALLPATDPLLDAMGFSRGRFIVESGATGPLVVPAWPEILRVVEDCRG